MTVCAPSGVLLCRPTYFDVIDVKNPFMDAAVPVDRTRAAAQWQMMREAFAHAGLEPVEMAPLRGAEDMVFTANPALTGIDDAGNRVAVAGRMKFESRRAEVPAMVQRLAALGYRIDLSMPRDVLFEGGGDALWHPSVHRLYCGYGWRTDERAIPFLERAFGVDVVPLRLVDQRFYHLDTALCAIDERTALIVPEAFEGRALREIERRFNRVIALDGAEALTMAANATSTWRGTVIIERTARRTAALLERLGYSVVRLSTSEFRKSGGSVYCLKQYLF